jgi:3-methyladenine DNA glycosylase/8-oxoguanine DNA glycosylase
MAPTRREVGFDAEAAREHLSSCDPRLARVIQRAGPIRIRLDPTQSTFETLAQSIVYQQLNGRAAATIHARLRALFPRKRIRPEPLLAAGEESLRGAGVSRGKMLALRDLAARTLDGTVPPLRELVAMSDEAIVERLVAVRGVGRWTVEMLLIFRLGRADVLPAGDYGVRHGFQMAYGRRTLPTPSELAKHGEKWRPFRTAATWYLWRAVEFGRKTSEGGG